MQLGEFIRRIGTRIVISLTPQSRIMSGPGVPVVYLSFPEELCEAPAVLTLTRMGLASASSSLALLPR
jgi:hypothetical protein